jgi:hypothetical protein
MTEEGLSWFIFDSKLQYIAGPVSSACNEGMLGHRLSRSKDGLGADTLMKSSELAPPAGGVPWCWMHGDVRMCILSGGKDRL